MSERRREPEDFLDLIRRQNRGKLKVYLGSSAGVGKTYAMLAEGNRLRREGVDAVIGYVEPHARPETTAQIGVLEVVAPKTVIHEGIACREMDLDAVLKRKPTVALVDELAHTNAPGTRHAKRYEDVEELLDAGISVVTTLNVQHLESLCNVVEEAVGVKVRERIPDGIVARADQIVNIDLPAEDLIGRLRAGKIYPADRVEAALGNFFTEANLTRLRELTFSEVANFLDRKRRIGLPRGAEMNLMARIIVAVSSRGPHPEALLRKTARLAAEMNAPWYAVYVRTRKEDPRRIEAETHRRLTDTLEIAQKMGGTVVSLVGDDVAAALGGFIREHGVTHAVIGRSRPRRGWRRFFPSLMERISEASGNVDIVLG